jgi:hypothetical protein
VLAEATPEELEERCGLSTDQANTLIALASNPNFQLIDLIISNDTELQADQPPGQPSQPQQPQQPQSLELSDEQLTAVLAETMVEAPSPRLPGKMNINTVSADLLQEIFIDEDPTIIDELLYYRNSRSEGVLSLQEFKGIPNIPPDKLTQLLGLFDVKSSVFTITSRGRSTATGLEVEIVAVVDRSTLPVTILEYREQ